MLDFIRKSLTSQFEASLAMLKLCVDACPPAQWEQKIANMTFRSVAYHTLFYADFYSSPSHEALTPRDFHPRGDGGDERGPAAWPGLSVDETLTYCEICRAKVIEAIAAETKQSLQEPSGLEWLTFSRFEAHLYNIRHIQHHAGQCGAFLRRVIPEITEQKNLPWMRAGWR